MRSLRVLGFWILAALLFNAGIFYIEGHQKALEFLTGYLIELSLSLDNLFVFYLIFSYFKLDAVQQARVLGWGVLGAQLMRLILILCGISLLERFNWMIYALGIFLVFAGIKLFSKGEKVFDIKKFFPQGAGSFLLILLIVELTDLLFALDSIPAVIAITKDPFIVYSSNIFAILGLRSMYFVLSPWVVNFKYLHYALGIILIFIGGKMLLDHYWVMPTSLALGFIVLVLGVFALVSLIKKQEVV